MPPLLQQWHHQSPSTHPHTTHTHTHNRCLPSSIAGIISALAAAIAAAGFPSGNDQLLASSQPGWQVAALLSCIAVACVSGYVAGLIVKHVNLFGSPQLRGSELFEDAVFWTNVEMEEEDEEDGSVGDVLVKGCQA